MHRRWRRWSASITISFHEPLVNRIIFLYITTKIIMESELLCIGQTSLSILLSLDTKHICHLYLYIHISTIPCPNRCFTMYACMLYVCICMYVVQCICKWPKNNPFMWSGHLCKYKIQNTFILTPQTWLSQLKTNFKVGLSLINPRPAGGQILPPPLSNIRDNFKTT